MGRAVDECVDENVLAEFFKEHRREVVEMAALDFTFERRERLIRRDSLEEGLEKGLITGRLEGKIELLREMQYSVSEIAERLAISEQKVKEVLQKNN